MEERVKGNFIDLIDIVLLWGIHPTRSKRSLKE